MPLICTRPNKTHTSSHAQLQLMHPAWWSAHIILMARISAKKSVGSDLPMLAWSLVAELMICSHLPLQENLLGTIWWRKFRGSELHCTLGDNKTKETYRLLVSVATHEGKHWIVILSDTNYYYIRGALQDDENGIDRKKREGRCKVQTVDWQIIMARQPAKLSSQST